MGRRKPSKPKRERPHYVTIDVDGQPAIVKVPMPLLDVPPSVLPEVKAMVRRMRGSGRYHPDAAVPLLS